MRLANVDGRAVLLATGDRGLDIATASGGKFGPELPALYEDWKGFRAWADSADLTQADVPFTRTQLGPPSPAPRQIVAIGLNYSEHAAESGFAVPDRLPPVFTK